MYSPKSFGKFWQSKIYLFLSLYLFLLCNSLIQTLYDCIHWCYRYAIFSSSISFWLPSIGIVYFYIEVSSIRSITKETFVLGNDYWKPNMHWHERGFESPLLIVNLCAYIDFKTNAQNSLMKLILKTIGRSKMIGHNLEAKSCKDEHLQSFSICPQSFIKRLLLIWLFFIPSSIQSYLYFLTANSASFDMQNLFSEIK